MRSFRLRKYRVEIKFLAITICLLGGLLLLNQTDALGALDGGIEDIFEVAEDFGFVGMFAIAVLGNSSLLIQIPYTVPLISLTLAGSDYPHLLWMGVASGVGAGIGEVISYGIAERILGRNPRLSESSLFRWVQRTVSEHPAAAPLLVFVWAASVLPDDTIIIPLATIRYGIRRIALPLFAGKVIHSVALVTIAHFFADWTAARVSDGVKTDLALGILIVFVMFILYQVERSRVSAKEPESAIV